MNDARLFLPSLALVCLAFNGPSVLAEGDAVGKAGVAFTFPTRSSLQPELSFQVLLPERSSANPKPKCIYYATWRANASGLEAQLLDDRSGIVRFARRNAFALVTWETRHLRKPEGSDADMSRELDLLCQTWSAGMKKIAAELGIDPVNGLGYGVSRGATYVQALANRYPDHFLGVHVHVGGFFEPYERAPEAPITLITTCEYDDNRQTCLKYYHALRKNECFPVFRSFRNLHHDTSTGTDALQTMFFEYVAGLMHKAHGIKREVALRHQAGIEAAEWCADLETNETMTLKDRAANSHPGTSREYQVLPDAWFAQRWMEFDSQEHSKVMPVRPSGAFLQLK